MNLYEKKKYFPKNEELFFNLVKQSFTQRRKTLVNNLSSKYSKDFIYKMLSDNGYKESIRAEELSIDDFIKLSDYINEAKND